MKTDPISLKPGDESNGLYYVYFWVASVTQPTEAWEAVPAAVRIIDNLARSPDLTANLHLAWVKDISHEGSIKLQIMAPGTKRPEAEAWIGTDEGKAWSKGTVGGALCQIALAIPK